MPANAICPADRAEVEEFSQSLTADMVHRRVRWQFTLEWVPGGERALFPESTVTTRPWWVPPSPNASSSESSDMSIVYRPRNLDDQYYSLLPLDLIAQFTPSEFFPRGCWYPALLIGRVNKYRILCPIVADVTIDGSINADVGLEEPLAAQALEQAPEDCSMGAADVSIDKSTNANVIMEEPLLLHAPEQTLQDSTAGAADVSIVESANASVIMEEPLPVQAPEQTPEDFMVGADSSLLPFWSPNNSQEIALPVFGNTGELAAGENHPIVTPTMEHTHGNSALAGSPPTANLSKPGRKTKRKPQIIPIEGPRGRRRAQGVNLPDQTNRNHNLVRAPKRVLKQNYVSTEQRAAESGLRLIITEQTESLEDNHKIISGIQTWPWCQDAARRHSPAAGFTPPPSSKQAQSLGCPENNAQAEGVEVDEHVIIASIERRTGSDHDLVTIFPIARGNFKVFKNVSNDVYDKVCNHVDRKGNKSSRISYDGRDLFVEFPLDVHEGPIHELGTFYVSCFEAFASQAHTFAWEANTSMRWKDGRGVPDGLLSARFTNTPDDEKEFFVMLEVAKSQSPSAANTKGKAMWIENPELHELEAYILRGMTASCASGKR
ncbi:hypothetical protein BJ138DRAFT_1107990 [Hygrophoropsis aurantiaca]|uniref:Uncharacterized protein n=1 Tax=Hygrophoropsis aurantiaca TaxID=72124 RepID=A0ACB7ZPR1_9AGAM|nr:hypothetical protein BJ138DRAFT_1107990 [Hygrophoropsis aurantiaca]